jgi:hypothetical protein
VRRLRRLLACAIVGLTLGIALYAGLVRAGFARNPFAPVAHGDLELARSNRAGLRVLFVGNSFTFENSLPRLVHKLAAADPGRPPIYSVEYALPGWTLEQASHDRGLERLLADVHWDVVVLQEQSQLLSFPEEQWQRETYPYAHKLDDEIRAAGAQTLLFMTWGYRLGDRRNYAHDTYSAMQARLESGYTQLGNELPATVEPVGRAWAEALRRDPDLQLWADDGKHPSLLGSYLAACVFYATLSRRDRSRSRFTAGLNPAEARFLQSVAAEVAG